MRRAGLRLGTIWRGGRERGVGAAAVATLGVPLTLPLLLLQTIAGDRLPDVITPLVEALYGGAPGGPAAEGHELMDSDAAADAVAERS
jgi:hypothetical protein